MDSGVSDIFLMTGAPLVDVDKTVPKVSVCTAAGQPESSSATCKLARPDLPDDVPTSGYVMPGFHHNLLGIGKFCDAECKVLFTKTTVTIFNKDAVPVLTGWREADGAKLWRMSLLPEEDTMPPQEDSQQAKLGTFSTYDLPSVQALVIYFHASAGYPVRDAWLKAIKAGNYEP